jgi:TRAP-type mannitol/chloroaromatic compound transport system permease large subunit
LSTPIALAITSIFTQMVSLYELILEYITARVERIATDPIVAVPGFTFGGVPLERPCTQGMLFSEVIVHLLERIERALGIGLVPVGGEAGLLAARQIQVLWSELDGRREIIPGRAVMRPADLRRLFGKVADIFRQLH